MRRYYLLFFCLFMTMIVSSQTMDSLIFSQTYRKMYINDTKSDSVEIVCDVIRNYDGSMIIELFDYRNNGDLTTYHFLIVKKIIRYSDGNLKYYVSKNENRYRIKWLVINNEYLNLKHKHNMFKRCFIYFFN